LRRCWSGLTALRIQAERRSRRVVREPYAGLVCLFEMSGKKQTVVPWQAGFILPGGIFQRSQVELVAAAGAREDLGEGKEDVQAVEIDAEGELYGGGAVAAVVDALEVDNDQDAEDGEREVGVDIRADEVEERAKDTYYDQHEQGRYSVVADAAVVEGEDLCAHAEDGH